MRLGQLRPRRPPKKNKEPIRSLVENIIQTHILRIAITQRVASKSTGARVSRLPQRSGSRLEVGAIRLE
jgi:hypothetical protein